MFSVGHPAEAQPSGRLLTGSAASLVGFQTGGPDTPMQRHQLFPTRDEFLNRHFPSPDRGRGRVHLAAESSTASRGASESAIKP